MKIAIWGAGRFGQALGHVFLKAGHKVVMYIRRIEAAEQAARQFGSEVVTYSPPDVSDFEHLFIATDTAGLLPALAALGQADRPNTSLWLVQKGDIPSEIFWSDAWQGIYYLTGAAFSRDLLADKVVGMILAARPKHWSMDCRAAELIRTLRQIRGVYWHDPRHIVGMNRLRTIGSLQRGMADQVLADSPSTRALAISSIETEARLIATKMDLRPLLNGTIGQASKVLRVLKADEELCAQNGSRNYHAGHLIGQGEFTSDQFDRLCHAHGVVESLGNVYSLCAELGESLPGFPYLSLTKRILDGEIGALDARVELEGRTDGWL